MEAAGTPRPANSAAHHIVGDTSKRAQAARDILNKHGIGVDDAVNGVFLPNRNNIDNMPGILHNGKHPNRYFDRVNNIIIEADELGGKQSVLEALDDIRKVLSDADRLSNWRNIIT